jgi:DNA-binding winged helix-turn-helix (wHTH) protein
MHPSSSSEARGAVLGKDALMARVWPDRIVEENARQSQTSALRAPLIAESHYSQSTLRTRSAVFFAPIFCMILAR